MKKCQVIEASRHICKSFVLLFTVMRVILIHGFNASPETNFHPWLKDQLHAKGFDVLTPTLSLTTKDLDLPAVIEQMKEQVGYLSSDDVILGHSLGAFVILQYLEAVEMTETPRAVIMVAPPWKVSNPELRRMFIADLDADVLMWKAREYVIVHSKDDTLVPIDHGRRFAKALKAKLLEVDGQGHFMDGEYPVLLEEIERISNTPFEFAPGETLEDEFKELP